MPAERLLDRAVEEIADGVPVDWSALESGAENAGDREYLKCLRILAGVADLHRSTDAGDDSAETEAPVSSSEPSTQVEMWGKYHLLKKVGEGTFGRVYRAWDPELEREVAIKILHEHVVNRDLKQRLLAEGRALARVRHANVVSVLGVESHGDRVGLCMEFIRGETLETELTARRTLSAREAALVGEDVCRALAAVHLAGFVHRDVKARNVMREQGGRIVLMDFGTGRETLHLANAGPFELAGTPVYMAPEVLDGEAATPCSDVYSVGVLMYHLVTGGYPVEGRTMDDLGDAHRAGRRHLLSERRPDLPLPFIRVIEKALATDPRERCPSAGALAEALGAISDTTKERGRSMGRTLAVVASVPAATMTLLAMLGILNSVTFNAALGRGDYATEGLGDWVKMGAQSLIGPAVSLVIGLEWFGLLIAVRLILLALSNHARQFDATVRRRLAEQAHRLGLRDASVIASAFLLVSAVALVVAWHHFFPLFNAWITTRISTSPVEALRLLAPDANNPRFSEYHVNYRKTFTWIALPSLVFWPLMARAAAKRGQPLRPGLLAGAAGVAVLTLVLMDFPWRLTYRNDFDAARWQQNDCYVLGRRQDETLLFCPTLLPPRNRIVKSTDPALQRTGVHENIFMRFTETSALR